MLATQGRGWVLRDDIPPLCLLHVLVRPRRASTGGHKVVSLFLVSYSARASLFAWPLGCFLRGRAPMRRASRLVNLTSGTHPVFRRREPRTLHQLSILDKEPAVLIRGELLLGAEHAFEESGVWIFVLGLGYKPRGTSTHCSPGRPNCSLSSAASSATSISLFERRNARVHSSLPAAGAQSKSRW